jgi:hypothetical protein
MSFKNFVQTQPEDLSIEEFQRLYEKYNMEYLVYFSDSFFKQSKAEEWFQDRYNPIHIVNTEKDAAENSRSEAERFKNSLLSSAEDFVAACSLEPSAQKFRKSFSASVTNTATDATTADSDAVVEGTEAAVSKAIEEIDGRHFSGHQSRTVYLSGVHACCPKSVLAGAIIARLRDGAENSPLTVEELTPERILISQPMWSNRVLDKFERSAWVVMPSVAATQAAIEALNNLEVAVPVKNAAADATFNFKIQAALHLVSRSTNTVLPDYICYTVRIKEDIKRALLLAKLFDEERDIPEEFRIASLLQQESVVQAVKHMHEYLDVLIAYLRRVHYVSFYNGRKFRDEAHLLLMSPCVTHRAKAFIPCDSSDRDAYVMSPEARHSAVEVTANELLQEAAVTVPATIEEEAAIAAAESEAEGGVTVSTGNEVAAGAEDDAGEDGRGSGGRMDADDDAPASNLTAGTSTSAVGVRINGRFIVTADRRIENMIRELKNRVRIRRLKEENPSTTGTIDEEDAKKLEALQEITFEKYVHLNSKIELNEKCRCMYPGCGKLFQNAVFIVKHFRFKHPGCADAELLIDAEPFMRRRFDEEDLTQRPLPPVEIEVNNRLEFKSVREVMEIFQKAKVATAGPFGGGNFHRDQHQRPHFDRHNSHRSSGSGQGGFHHSGNRGRDNDRFQHNRNNNYRDRDSFGSNGGNNNRGYNNKRNRDSFEDAPTSVGGSGGADGAPEESFKVTVSNGANPVPAARRYMDVDAPKVTLDQTHIFVYEMCWLFLRFVRLCILIDCI